MGLFSRLKRVQQVSTDVLGIFDTTRGADDELIAADTDALAPFFGEVRVEHEQPPACGVLIVYCRFNPEAEIVGCALDLGEVIAAAGAAIVLVASPHESACYEGIRQRSSWTPSNLVLTLDRCDDLFPRFFERLFSLMASGTSMPVAWSKLAPQGGNQNGVPEALFICELAQTALAPRTEAQ